MKRDVNKVATTEDTTKITNKKLSTNLLMVSMMKRVVSSEPRNSGLTWMLRLNYKKIMVLLMLSLTSSHSRINAIPSLTVKF